MSGAALFKIAVIATLIIILMALGAGLVFLVRDKGQSKRAVKSLTLRIALSIALFILLFVGYFTGMIRPHGINPQAPPAPPAALAPDASEAPATETPPPARTPP